MLSSFIASLASAIRYASLLSRNVERDCDGARSSESVWPSIGRAVLAREKAPPGEEPGGSGGGMCVPEFEVVSAEAGGRRRVGVSPSLATYPSPDALALLFCLPPPAALLGSR